MPLEPWSPEGPAFAELRAIRANGEETLKLVKQHTEAIAFIGDRVRDLHVRQDTHADWLADDHQEIAALQRARTASTEPSPPRRRSIPAFPWQWLVVAFASLTLTIAGLVAFAHIVSSGEHTAESDSR